LITTRTVSVLVLRHESHIDAEHPFRQKRLNHCKGR